MRPALTFDFWDTLFVDDSDEEERARRGLPTKAEARRLAFHAALEPSHGHLTPSARDAAWATANTWAKTQWDAHRHTPTVSARVEHALHALGIRGLPALHDLVDELEAMELDPSPVPAPGMLAAVQELARDHQMAIISDTIMSPGRALRRILDDHGLLACFDVCVFSDEVGRSKPDPFVFHHAADRLGRRTTELVHVGDRQGKDVAGVQAVGGRAVLFTAVRDRHGPDHTADVVCADPSRLAELIATLPGASS